MRRTRPLALLVVLGVLTGCASAQSGGTLHDALAGLSEKVVLDLDAAQAIAVANGDEIAAACYPTLKEWLTTKLGTSTPTLIQVQGVFSTFEAARTTRMRVESAMDAGPEIPVKVKLACAALVQDERLFALRLGAMIGGSAIGVPGLGAIVPR